VTRKDLESAGVRITYGRGLIAVPFGLCFIVVGLGNLRWALFANNWVFGASLACIAAAALLVLRYYDAHFGKATFPRKQQLRLDVTAAALTAAALIGGVVLDNSLDLSVSLFTMAYALSATAWLASTVGLKLHHIVVAIALLAAGAAPIWGDLADRVSVAWLPIGVATILVGLLDHFDLVRTYRTAPPREDENVHVEA
jgi:hypothetical protein